MRFALTSFINRKSRAPCLKFETDVFLIRFVSFNVLNVTLKFITAFVNWDFQLLDNEDNYNEIRQWDSNHDCNQWDNNDCEESDDWHNWQQWVNDDVCPSEIIASNVLKPLEIITIIVMTETTTVMTSMKTMNKLLTALDERLQLPFLLIDLWNQKNKTPVR